MKKRRPLPPVLDTTKPPKFVIEFGGKYIVLTAICRQSGIKLSYLSQIISGKKNARITTVQKICAVIDMTTDEFLLAVDARRKYLGLLHQRNMITVEDYMSRIKREDKSKIPALPGTRL